MQSYTGVFIKDGEWISAFIEEIPGVNTQGKTLEEAKENLVDALKMIIEIRKEKVDKYKDLLIKKEVINI